MTKKKVEDYFNYTQPDIDVPSWYNPTAKVKEEILPQTPMMGLLSSFFGPEEWEQEMLRQSARKKSWDDFARSNVTSGPQPISMAGGAVSSPLASAPAGENLQWIPQVSPEAQLERTALVHGLDDRPPVPIQAAPDMYSQAVALDPTREPAAAPVEYAQRTLPMNADEATMARVMALNGNGMTPAIDPTVRVPDQIVNGMPFAQPQVTQGYPTTTIQSFDPAFLDLTRPTTGPTTRPNYAPTQAPIGNILKDSAGNPVMMGGGHVGLPAQSVGNVATGGGKGGAGGK